MVLLTMIARVADGLPLAASMQEDEQVSPGDPAPGSRCAPRPVLVRPARGILAASRGPQLPPRGALSRPLRGDAKSPEPQAEWGAGDTCLWSCKR